NLDELSVVEQLPGHAALGLERGNERYEHDKPRIDHQPGDMRCATDVLDAVGIGEAKIAVQTMAGVVAIEDECMPAVGVQFLLDQVGDRGLARSGQPREPEAAWPLAFELGPRCLADVE